MNKTAVKLLLVEDNPADAHLVREMLEQDYAGEFDVTHVDRLAPALDLLDQGGYAVVLLDLSLPDEFGTPTLNRALQHAGGVPVVVLTGFDSDTLGVEAVAKGAQDYVVKGASAQLLARAIRHAVQRRSLQAEAEKSHAHQIETLHVELGHQKKLLALAGLRTADSRSSKPLAQRAPKTFATLQAEYENLLDRHLDSMAIGEPMPGDRIALLARALGERSAGARDLVDLHLRAVAVKAVKSSAPRSSAYIPEGRLLALEVMGALADYYRGARARAAGGDGSARGATGAASRGKKA